MQVTRFRDAGEFRARALPFLMRGEAENNLLLDISGGTSPFREDAYLAIVEHAGTVIACALRTPPFKAVISRAEPAAIECLVADLEAKYADLPEVLGPEPDVARFADLWARTTGVASLQGSRQRLFEIHQPLDLETQVAGGFRVAGERDFPTAAAWCKAFIDEALPGEPIDPRAYAAARIAEGSLFFWDDRRPVSMAGWAGKTLGGVRIRMVYTPPEYRGRGYATACVARLTQQLLDEGRAFCCLYADLSNPTSNSIYQKIGYRPICDWSNYFLNSRKTGSI